MNLGTRTPRAELRARVAPTSALNVIAGAWLFFSPWILGFSGLAAAFWSCIVVGAVVAILAVLRAAGAYRRLELSWINAAGGIWTFFSPWALGFSDHRTPLWNAIVVGAVIAVLAASSAQATRALLARGAARRRDAPR